MPDCRYHVADFTVRHASIGRIDHETEEAVCRFLALIASRYDMAGAIGYGSRARSTHRPDSDADVAALTARYRLPMIRRIFNDPGGGMTAGIAARRSHHGKARIIAVQLM